MRIGLHHYGIYCRDIEESIAFYVDVLGFKHLFSTMAMEGDKPLKMAWVKSADGVIAELLEQEDKSTIDAAGACLNHVAVRVASMDDIVARLEERGVAIEAGPFDALCEFDRPLEDADGDVFQVYGEGARSGRSCSSAVRAASVSKPSKTISAPSRLSPSPPPCRRCRRQARATRCAIARP